MSVSEKLTTLVAEIEEAFKKTDNVSISTCDSNAYGWDAERHEAMLLLYGSGIRKWRISHSNKHAVNDWKILDLAQIEKTLEKI